LSLAPSSADAPVLKVGAVVLRFPASIDVRSASEPRKRLGVSDARSEGDKESPSIDNLQILIIRPIPKHKGEVPAFVLPRGSRQYRDAHGQWHDARDAATGERNATTLEPLERALAREIEEEAGVTPTQLAAAWVHDLGRMDFQSRSKGVYPIHWFVVVPDAATAAQLDKQTPADALEVRFASFDEIKTMASRGEFSAGYIPVIEAALARANGAA
jgi:8-oxo-dGTP pyrophosphatase MutT (NUDIX family)